MLLGRSALRIALLSMVEPADGGVPLRRAFLRVGGKTLARHQLDIAVACDCERIVCISAALEPEVIALQHDAEDSGKQFNVVAGPRDLARLLTAQDELVVFAEGLLAPPLEAARLIGAGAAVLVQPAETGLEAGFERIDLNRASGGLLRIPARLAEPLFDLPQDCDVPSTLTRIALQRGVEIREIPASARSGGKWQLILSETEAYAAEAEWLAGQLRSARKDTPVHWLAHAGVSLFGSSLLHYGNASRALSLAAIAATGLGLAWAWLGAVATGLLFCAMAWVLVESGITLNQLENSPEIGKRSGSRGFTALGGAVDLAILAIIAMGSVGREPISLSTLIFPPLMLLLLARLVPQLNAGVISDWLVDRIILVLLVSIASILGVLPDATRLLCVLLIAAALVLIPTKRG